MAQTWIKKNKDSKTFLSDPSFLIVVKQPAAPTSPSPRIERETSPPSPEGNIRDAQADKELLAIEQPNGPHRPKELLAQQQLPDQPEKQNQQQPQVPRAIVQIIIYILK
ncbi:hypothetical protein TKK_0018077 [Trichogramma kaykai]